MLGISRILLLACGLFTVCVLFATGVVVAETGETTPSKPNILLILTDDHRYDDVDTFLPITKRRIFDKGLRFEKAYTTTPSCNASRTSLLTGMYASEHGVSGNRYVFEGETIVHRLQREAGYTTAHVGKFLNSWDGSQRPEYNYWVSFAGGSHDYVNPMLNIQGYWSSIPGYITDIFAEQAVRFLESDAAQNAPFFLTLSFTAPHAPSLPHPKDAKLFSDIPPYRPANFNEIDRSDKPLWLREKSSLSEPEIAFADWLRLSMQRTLPSVDRAIDRVLETLEDSGKLKNTVIIFASDNGFFHGEHSLLNKDAQYEEAIHVPLAIRYSKVFPAQSTDQVTGLLDIAPTVLELAGLPESEAMSGKSLVHFARTEEPHREDLLIESFRNGASRSSFSAVHTGNAVLIKNKTRGNTFDPHRYELYDLEKDPQQLLNVFGYEEYASIQTPLFTRLRDLLEIHRGRLNFIRPDAERLESRPMNPSEEGAEEGNHPFDEQKSEQVEYSF